MVGKKWCIVAGISRETGDGFYEITTITNGKYLTRLIRDHVQLSTRVITVAGVDITIL